MARACKVVPRLQLCYTKKGQEYIDKVKQENLQLPSLAPITSITEQDLDTFIELDIIKATLNMGFPLNAVRKTLRRKLEQTGLPFFRFENCTSLGDKLKKM